MATYILLASFTDQGIRKIKDSPKRADAFKEMAKKCGATVKDVFWTLGSYDVVAVVEAPDDMSMTALGLSTGALGNVRTQTLRALSSPYADGTSRRKSRSISCSCWLPMCHAALTQTSSSYSERDMLPHLMTLAAST